MSEGNERHAVYGLHAPNEKEPRYVGITIDEFTRLNAHIQEAKSGASSPKCEWIRGLLSIGLKPEMRIIKYAPDREHALRIERAAIIRFHGKGNLTNLSIPGKRRAKRCGSTSKTRGRFVGAWISREDHKAFKAECARDGRTIQNYLQRMISKLVSKKP